MAAGKCECRRLVQGDVVRLIALDLVLGIFRARVVRIPFVVDVLDMHFEDCSANATSFRVPGHMIANSEFMCHCIPQSSRRSLLSTHVVSSSRTYFEDGKPAFPPLLGPTNRLSRPKAEEGTADGTESDTRRSLSAHY